ncbi:MAG: RdgB/HAM1 family non-canonical purine NTP pyrophosphatase [Chloroflexi bacterium]|nr:RdgB/HAM1 family non-canonical purine NTP pyrophosphatase [Chloroflexota bacterium]
MDCKLLLATNNRGKVREFRSLLSNLPLQLVTTAEMGITTVVDEVGGSFEENARLKAVTLAAESHLLALADDSGLEVDALGGEPGHLSARYGGEGLSDSDRVDYLLSKLKDVPWDKRSASFCSVIAVAIPGGEVELCYGRCHGIIAFEPKGEHGFGYDPVFFMPELGKTMAELSPEVKNQVSHRALAAGEAYKVLERLIGKR